MVNKKRKKSPTPEDQTDAVIYTDDFDVYVEKQIGIWMMPYVPHCITPNQITVINFFARVGQFFFAVVGMRKEPASKERFAYLLLAIFLVFAGWILDYLDGMQARATNRCSRFGHGFDHWVDSLGVPMTAAAYAICFEADVFNLSLSVAGAALVFYLQITAWRLSPRRVWHHPRLGGATGQVAVVVSCLVLAIAEYVGHKECPPFLIFRLVTAISGNIGYFINIFILAMTVKRAGVLMYAIPGFIVLCGLGASCMIHYKDPWDLVWSGTTNHALPVEGTHVQAWWNPVAAFTFICVASLRMNGTTILATLGNHNPKIWIDVPTYGCTLAIFVALLMKMQLPFYIPYALSAFLFVVGAVDLCRFALNRPVSPSIFA